MQNETNRLSRREWVKLAGITAAAAAVSAGIANGEPPAAVSLFDGRTLDGWLQIENNATSLSSGAIIDPAAFAAKLTNGLRRDVGFSARARLEDLVKADLAAYSASNANAKALISALVKDLNQVIAGPSIYDAARFHDVVLQPGDKAVAPAESGRAATRGAAEQVIAGRCLSSGVLAVLSPSTGWMVKNSAMASTGTGRGVIYSANDYGHFRLMFTMRHVSGNPDHQACVLIFCSRPAQDGKPLDALGGIQFQVPNGGHWDYRPGMNNAGGPEFTQPAKGRFDIHEWSRVEIVADASRGIARMAVAQPPGSKAVEVLDFKDPAAGKVGPIAWQMHNAGLFDEYKDVTIEIDPKDNDLITVK